MILHQYLLDNGLSLDDKTISLIGQAIGDKYREKFNKSPSKHRVKGLIGKINHYPPSFLDSCSDLIIELINPITTENNG